jgi:hypothetical protein
MAGWKSEKDREAFIAKMQEAGFDQAEIDADVQAIDAQKSAPVAAPPPALKPSSQAGGGGSPMTQPEVAAPSMTAAPAQSVQADLTSMKQAREDQGNSLTDQIFNVENAQLLGIPLAAYGGYKLADKALEKSGLKARIFGQPTPIDRTVDVPLEATPDNKLSQAAQQPKISAQEQAMLDRSEINRLAKERDAAARALAAGPAPIPEPPAFIRNQPPAGSVAPVTPAPVVPAPVAPQAPAPVAAPAPAPVVTEAPKTAVAPVIPESVPTAATEVASETKPTAKTTKTKTPKPEYFEGFKKLPGTERQVLGTFGVAGDTERAKTLVNALKSTLPEGATLEFPKSTTGVSLGGMPNASDVMSFTNKHLGTGMKLDEKGKFPADFKFTDENLSKMHQSVLKELENAKTPEALAKAQKGMATLGALAGVAGTSLAALAAYSAYQKGKKTGDYTDLGMLGVDTIAGAINPALLFGTYMGGLNTGEAEALAKERYKDMVGGGRGVAPPSPRSQVGRR